MNQPEPVVRSEVRQVGPTVTVFRSMVPHYATAQMECRSIIADWKSAHSFPLQYHHNFLRPHAVATGKAIAALVSSRVLLFLDIT